MTAALAAPVHAAEPASTPTTPRVVERWERWRRVVLVVGIVLLTAILLGVVASQDKRGYLDPAGVDPSGARALVRLLAEGVTVDDVRTIDQAATRAGPGNTLIVTIPDLVLPEQARRLTRTGADIVLVAPSDAVSAFDDDLAVDSRHCRGHRSGVRPGGGGARGRRAGGWHLLRGAGSARSCYPDGDAGSLVVTTPSDGARLVVLGNADPLTNQYLDEDGNASLALGLLGGHSGWSGTGRPSRPFPAAPTSRSPTCCPTGWSPPPGAPG